MTTTRKRIVCIVCGLVAFAAAGPALGSVWFGSLGVALIMVGIGCFAGAVTVDF